MCIVRRLISQGSRPTCFYVNPLGVNGVNLMSPLPRLSPKNLGDVLTNNNAVGRNGINALMCFAFRVAISAKRGLVFTSNTADARRYTLVKTCGNS